MDTESSVRGISAIRLGVGAAAWLTPRLAGKAFMLDTAGNPQSPYLARLFGIRDVALAYGTTSSTGDARRTWLTAGLACDVADTLAAIAGGRAGYLSRTQTILLAAPAIAATALGAAALAGGTGD
ncbi:MAG: hypothetical protein QOJ97_1971 [Solirubrobacteraceae bacterium]|jgi:hypothetical protein|nr:hypothetical protein [Solirubrobacteraceae bacterium]